MAKLFQRPHYSVSSQSVPPTPGGVLSLEVVAVVAEAMAMGGVSAHGYVMTPDRVFWPTTPLDVDLATFVVVGEGYACDPRCTTSANSSRDDS